MSECGRLLFRDAVHLPEPGRGSHEGPGDTGPVERRDSSIHSNQSFTGRCRSAVRRNPLERGYMRLLSACNLARAFCFMQLRWWGGFAFAASTPTMI